MHTNSELTAGTLFGHPRGLFVLFFTEMWERFSFYGMRALLVYYMIKHLLLPQGQASHIYGLYCGLVYFTPFLGGILADRYLGQHRSVVLGGIIMAVGHFLMAFESMFYPALLFLIVGNGAFKPNISAQVGGLYPEKDPRRDRAFSIFYVGINLGAFLAPLICGTLGELLGWHYGFAAAGFGMLAGLCIYLLGRKHLPQDRISGGKGKGATAAEEDDRSSVSGLLAICAIVVVFWAVYEQMGNTMALWVDGDTDRSILGWEMPASWFQSFNPFLIFTLTPLITTFWAWQAGRGKEPSSGAKMAIGMFIAGLAFALMIYPARNYALNGTPVSMFWLLGFTLLLTLAELYISPVGLSLITKLAPKKMVSMFLGIWFMAQFFGNLSAGFLGGFWDRMPKSAFFALIAALAGLACILNTAMLKSLRKSLHK